MPVPSKFHQLYEQNKEYYDTDAKNLTYNEFMKKHHIGSTMYGIYFRWVSLKNRTYNVKSLSWKQQELRDNYHNMIRKAKERQDNCVEYFNDTVKRLAEKFGVSKSEIKKLTLDYTLSEIEKWYLENGKIKIRKVDEIRMKKPGGILESIHAPIEIG